MRAVSGGCGSCSGGFRGSFAASVVCGASLAAVTVEEMVMVTGGILPLGGVQKNVPVMPSGSAMRLRQILCREVYILKRVGSVCREPGGCNWECYMCLDCHDGILSTSSYELEILFSNSGLHQPETASVDI